jgi:hypothetical protein
MAEVILPLGSGEQKTSLLDPAHNEKHRRRLWRDEASGAAFAH